MEADHTKLGLVDGLPLWEPLLDRVVVALELGGRRRRRRTLARHDIPTALEILGRLLLRPQRHLIKIDFKVICHGISLYLLELLECERHGLLCASEWWTVRWKSAAFFRRRRSPKLERCSFGCAVLGAA